MRFQAEQLHSAQAFAVFDSDSSPIFRRRLFAFSNKAILFFLGAVTAQSGRQFGEIFVDFFVERIYNYVIRGSALLSRINYNWEMRK